MIVLIFVCNFFPNHTNVSNETDKLCTFKKNLDILVTVLHIFSLKKK